MLFPNLKFCPVAFVETLCENDDGNSRENNFGDKIVFSTIRFHYELFVLLKNKFLWATTYKN